MKGQPATMSLLELISLALALAVDAFSVGVSVALTHRTPRQALRLSFHFGLFQSLLALVGILAGRLLFAAIQHIDHWVACLLLAGIGLRMLRGERDEGRRAQPSDLTRGLSLVGLSLAVSIDAAAAGVGLAALEAPLALAVCLIGLVSFLATLLAFALSGPLRARLGRHAERVAGVVLILLGVKILVEHLR
ncbi:manganese efflux pump [bacterium]|nr:manganese efflux pump [bacterium]